MRVSTRIFFCYLIITSVCFYFSFDWVLDTTRSRYLEGVEDPLVDQASVLAALAERELGLGIFDAERWYGIFGRIREQTLTARIYRLTKERVDTRVYITDARGIVIFDSEDRKVIGADYSAWRDVHLTLRGEYGARTTKTVIDDEASSVLYVAAPLVVDGRIAGVLTVGKPTTNITWFVENAKLQIVGIGLSALLAAWLLSFFVSRWITRPIKRLTEYADAIRHGQRPSFPRLGDSEIGAMGRAFEKMQEALEGKHYVEHYIQNLTHELKSPLSAIRGAAELLAEPMAERQRCRFLDNIARETRRIQQIVDRMLELAALENRKKLLRIDRVPVQALVRTVLESMETACAGKRLRTEMTAADDTVVAGDAFLLQQALGNLVRNAVDFSPEQGTITIMTETDGTRLRFIVTDEGTGIADFARERIFEKFFSLQRPDTGQKSTGLGLNFVRQIALLHGGTIRLENRTGCGTAAVLDIAVHPGEAA